MVWSKQLLVKMPREEKRLLKWFLFPEMSGNFVDCQHPDRSSGCKDKNAEKVHTINEDQ
jgi:hypothetical protein